METIIKSDLINYLLRKNRAYYNEIATLRSVENQHDTNLKLIISNKHSQIAELHKILNDIENNNIK